MKKILFVLSFMTLAGCDPSITNLTVSGPATMFCGESDTYTVTGTLDATTTWTVMKIVHIDEDDYWDDTLTNSVALTFPPNTLTVSKPFGLECTEVGCFLAGKDDSSNVEPFYEVHAEKDNLFRNVESANFNIKCLPVEEAEEPSH